jgi:hypothetical protein
MIKTLLAFEFSKTHMICNAFDEAWASLQGVGSDLTAPSKSLASRTILAKRIIEMADQGLMDVTELRDDALAFIARKPCGGDAGISACGADASLRPTRSRGARIVDANAATTRVG